MSLISQGRRRVTDKKRVVAAQVSRDRKKHLSESLETRVAELEAQLDATSSSASSSSSTRHVVPPHPRLSPSPVDTSYLEEENLSLRLQLQLEQSNGAALKLRLVSLEESFSRLERLLAPGLPAAIPTTTLPLTPAADFPMDASATSEEFVDETSFRLPAVEDPLQRGLSNPTSPKTSSRPLPPRLSLSTLLSSITIPTLLLRSCSTPSMSSSSGPHGAIGQISSLPSRRGRVVRSSSSRKRRTFTRLSSHPRFQLQLRR